MLGSGHHGLRISATPAGCGPQSQSPVNKMGPTQPAQDTAEISGVPSPGTQWTLHPRWLSPPSPSAGAADTMLPMSWVPQEGHLLSVPSSWSLEGPQRVTPQDKVRGSSTWSASVTH